MSGAGRRISAIVLAAGASSRFGAPKQLHLMDGEPLVRRAVRAAREAGAAPVFVVTGGAADGVTTAVQDLDGTRIVMNAQWAEGIGSSLMMGLRAVQATTGIDRVLVTLADQPLVDAAALGRLVTVSDTARVAAAAYDGIIGVPVVIGAEHLESLLSALEPGTGAGRWLRANAALVARVPMPEAALDVDTPADAQRLTTAVDRPPGDVRDIAVPE